MERYIIGKYIDGLELLEMDSDRVKEIEDRVVVVVLGNESNGKLYSYYVMVKGLLMRRNRVILLLDGNVSRIRKQISMLLVSYGGYDIYTVDSLDDIDSKYIDKLEGRVPSKEEVMTFIGADIMAFGELSEIMLKITDSIRGGDIEGLRGVIEDNVDNIENFIDIIDYMKSVVDKVNSGEVDKKVNELKMRVEDLEVELQGKERGIQELKKGLEDMVKERDSYKREAINAKQKVMTLEGKLTNKEPVIKTYAELQTQQIRCRTKVILYFKEISHISYMASMVTKYMDYLVKVKRVRVKLMVYDNKSSFIGTYKPIPIIGSNEFMSNRDIVVNKHDKLVVVEANQAIIEDVIMSDWDIVIVYDRLKQSQDIVSGNNVYKFWVLNSISEYNALNQAYKIDKSKVITRPGVFPESIAIQCVQNYKNQTESGKLATYVSMCNTGSNNNKVFDIISDMANINNIQSRGR